MTDSAPTLLILGRGHLGRSLCAAAGAAGMRVALEPAREAAPPAPGAADVVLLAVPDRAISELAERIAFGPDASASTGFAHLSGAVELDALAALVPLMRGSLDALATAGLPDALSGPLRRGDVAIVARHLAAIERLEDAPALADAYRSLGAAATALAVEAGLEPEVAARVEALLGHGR